MCKGNPQDDPQAVKGNPQDDPQAVWAEKGFRTGYDCAVQQYEPKLQSEQQQHLAAKQSLDRLKSKYNALEAQIQSILYEHCEEYQLQLDRSAEGPFHWLHGSSLRTASCLQTETYSEGDIACAYHLQRAFFAKYPNEYLYIMHRFY